MTAQPTTRISTSPFGPQGRPRPPVEGIPQQPYGVPQSFGPQSFGPQSFGPQSYGPQSYGPPSYGPPSFGPGHPAPFTPPPAPPAPSGRGVGRIVGIVASVLVVLGGLGTAALFLFGPRTVDPQSVQQEIVRITRTAVQVAPADVRCPDKIKAETGGTFACTATVDGQPVTYKVRQDDDKGHLTIDFDRLIKVADLQRGVADLVGRDINVPVDITCEPAGRTVVVTTPGAPISCTAINAADPSDTAKINVTVDAEGTPAYTFV